MRIKRKIGIVIIAVCLFYGCKQEIDLNGDIEVHVREVSSVCSISYDEIIIGLYPSGYEASNGYYIYNAIDYDTLDDDGVVRFENLPSDTYVVAVIGSFCNAWKYALVRGGEVTNVELID